MRAGFAFGPTETHSLMERRAGNEASKEDFFRVLSEEIRKPIDPMELVYPNEVPVFEKYDDRVPAALIRKGFAYGILDIEGLRKRISEFESKTGD